MRLLILRHCETDWNKAKKVQGSVDIPLNENGIKQAEYIRDNINFGSIDFCITSPMIRAKQTAEIICDNEITIFEDEFIKERGFGDYEGEIIDNSIILKQWDFNCDGGLKNIETLSHLFKRAEIFLNSLIENYSDKNILIVTHGAFLKALYFVINGYDKNTDLLSFFPENGKVYDFEIPVRINKRTK